MKKISEILTKYQKDNNYTYQELAKSLHMSKSTIYAYIHNTRNPSIKSVQNLAKSLNLKPMYLLDNNEENSKEDILLKELQKSKEIYQLILDHPKEARKQLEKSFQKKNNEL